MKSILKWLERNFTTLFNATSVVFIVALLIGIIAKDILIFSGAILIETVAITTFFAINFRAS
ncbi:MAG: hypothetical protein LBU68_00405 [Rickettsiales bacterium]|jgi:hypothetical protein|nr:hypothetical protein [Rickettsiales bacterium]